MKEGLYLKRVEPHALRNEERLVSRTPIYPVYQGYDDTGETDAGSGSSFEQYCRAVYHRKWMIAAIVVLVTAGVAAWVYTSGSSYRATAIIEVGKEDTTLIQVSDNLIVQNDDTPKTKSFILRSTPLLEDVISNLRLDSNEGFLKAVAQTPDGIDGSKPGGAESLRNEMLIGALEKGLEIEEVPDTRLLKVSFTHTDPAMAADVSNAVVENLIKRSLEGKTEKFSQASTWIERETLKLRQKMIETEKALAGFTREHSVAAPEGAATVTVEKLSRLHSEAMRAEADRILKGSIYDEARNGRIAQVPEAFTNPRALDLQRKLGELTTTLAQLDANYGPESPQFIEVQQQIDAVQEQIDANTQIMGDKLKGDYERAARDEQALKSMLGQAKSEAVQQNQTALRYSILKAEFDTAKSLYNDFLQKTNQANFQVAQQQNNLRIIQPARPPKEAAGLKRSVVTGLGFAVSLLLSIGLALVLEHLDKSIKSPQDVHQQLQLATVGVIPAMTATAPRLLKRKSEDRSVGVISSAVLEKVTKRPYNSMSLAAEAYRVLRTSLLLSSADKPPKILLFTSTRSGEGKTTTAVNIATSLAQLDRSVLVIDCDLRKPTVHKLFGAAEDPGLATYLLSDARLDSLIRRLPAKNLSLLPAGTCTANPAELLSSEKMKHLLMVLASRYDHVLIDAPPLVNLAEPLVLSTMADGVILVVNSGKSERAAVLRARDELINVGAEIFGVVLNNVDFRREGLGDYYKNYYRQS